MTVLTTSIVSVPLLTTTDPFPSLFPKWKKHSCLYQAVKYLEWYYKKSDVSSKFAFCKCLLERGI